MSAYLMSMKLYETFIEIGLNGMYMGIFAFEFCCKPIPYMVSNCAGETKSRASVNCNAH